MNQAAYIWKDGEMIVHTDRLSIREADTLGFLHIPIVNTRYEKDRGRTGMFVKNTGTPIHGPPIRWLDQQYEELPAEFRMHLLLLGVA